MSKSADRIRKLRRPIIGLVLIAELLLGWMTIGWGPWSFLTSLIEGREQPIIWGAVLSMPMPVVATAIIVSLRLLNVGTGQAREQRTGARPGALAREWQTEARPPGVQQLQVQQMAPQMAQKPQQMPQQMAQMPQQIAPQTADMLQQQMQQQMAQMPQQMAPQMVGMEQQAPQQMEGLLGPMQDWLRNMQDQLRRMLEQAPRMQQSLAPMQDQLAQMQERLGQVQGEMTPLEMQQLWGQMQLQMGQSLGRLRHLQHELPGGVTPELARLQQLTTQIMAQIQQQLAQLPPVERTGVPQFQEEQPALQKSELEETLGDILADAFEEEKAMDPHLQALADSLEYVDVLDLLEKGKEIVDQLRRGISLAPGLIYEIRGVEP